MILWLAMLQFWRIDLNLLILLYRIQNLKEFRFFIWLPVAVLAFPERNTVANKWSMCVLVVWLFTAYILMQSYTAKLSLMFTLDQLNFAFSTDFNVGYQHGSFVKDYLINELHLDETKLKSFTTIKEYHNAMRLGSKKSGIDAIYAELPYVRLLLSRYSSQYRMVGPRHKTGGFEFAFPMGSPLVSYFSRAILNVTQISTMADIEQKNFGPGYPSDLNSINHENPNLTPYNFGGLFIIVLSVTVLAVSCSKTSFGQSFTATVLDYSHKCSNLLILGGNNAKIHLSQSSDEATSKSGENGASESPRTGESPETLNHNVDIDVTNRITMSVVPYDTSEVQLSEAN